MTLYLPRELTLTAATGSRPAAAMPSHGIETLLLVEDEAPVRRVAKRILESAGYSVLTAANGEEGLLVCAQSATRIDLVLTDVVMPVMGGRAFAERAVQMRPGIKVVYMSGYTGDAIAREGVLEAGTRLVRQAPDAERAVARGAGGAGRLTAGAARRYRPLDFATQPGR